jgi:hypothetical protein
MAVSELNESSRFSEEVHLLTSVESLRGKSIGGLRPPPQEDIFVEMDGIS